MGFFFPKKVLHILTHITSGVKNVFKKGLNINTITRIIEWSSPEPFFFYIGFVKLGGVMHGH